ncbi:MAG: HlyD family secretion protein [Acidobacteria bacterium]|nr:HlyD family secretion protein [Acidobacteriota bacterium]
MASDNTVELERPPESGVRPKTELPPPPPPKSRLGKAIPLLVLAALVVGGVLLWRRFFLTPPVPESLVLVSGRIEGDDSAVAPKTAGRILEIRVREGDTVASGDIIAALDYEQVRAREAQARAGLAQAAARSRSAVAAISVLNEQQRQNESEVRQQEAASELAEFDRAAYTRLAETGAVSERQGRQAASAARQQNAALSAAKQRVAAVKMQIAQQQAEISSANASTEQAHAQLVEAQANRRDLVVRAPFSGTVITRAAEPGEVVTAGTPIITLLDLSKVYLRAFVPQGEIGKVKVGQRARVYLDSSPDQPIDAYVSRIDPQATFTPENTYFREDRVKQVVGVKLELQGGVGFAKPGMPADGEILVLGDSWPSFRWKR